MISTSIVRIASPYVANIKEIIETNSTNTVKAIWSNCLATTGLEADLQSSNS
jgi:hypothetical protein